MHKSIHIFIQVYVKAIGDHSIELSILLCDSFNIMFTTLGPCALGKGSHGNLSLFGNCCKKTKRKIKNYKRTNMPKDKALPCYVNYADFRNKSNVNNAPSQNPNFHTIEFSNFTGRISDNNHGMHYVCNQSRFQ